MNDEILGKLLDWASGIESFARDQVPDFAEQVVRWGIWGNFFSGCVTLVLAVSTGILAKWLIKKYRAENKKDWTLGDGYALGAVLCIIFMAIFIVCALCDFYECVKAATVPKVYLIEFIRKGSK